MTEELEKTAVPALGIPARLTPTGIEDVTCTTIAEWIVGGLAIAQLATSSHWWVGKWFRIGVEKFGDEACQLEAETLQFNWKTVLNKINVDKRVPDDVRRQELSWSHHEAVAPLEVPKQVAYLEYAIEARLNAHELRAHIEACGDAVRARSEKQITTQAAINSAVTNARRLTPGQTIIVEVECYLITDEEYRNLALSVQTA